MAQSIVQPKFAGLKNLFAVVTYTIVTSQSVSSLGGSGSTAYSISKPGYYPLSIMSWQLEGSYSTFSSVPKFNLYSRASGSAKISATARSLTKSTATITYKVYVLWVKE